MKQENPVTTSTTLSTWKPAAGNQTIPRRESEDVIELSSSNDEGPELDGIDDIESVDRTGGDVSGTKRARSDSIASPAKKLAVLIPDDEEGFTHSTTPGKAIVALPATPCNVVAAPNSSWESCKQFWKAGDYEGTSGGDWEVSAG